MLSVVMIGVIICAYAFVWSNYALKHAIILNIDRVYDMPNFMVICFARQTGGTEGRKRNIGSALGSIGDSSTKTKPVVLVSIQTVSTV